MFRAACAARAPYGAGRPIRGAIVLAAAASILILSAGIARADASQAGGHADSLSRWRAGAVQSDLLISRQLADAEGVRVGDIVSLSADPSGAGAVPFRIAGVYEPVANPIKLTDRRWEVRMHLPDLIGMTAVTSDPLAPDSVMAINVALKDPSDDTSFAADVRARMPGLDAGPTRRLSDESDLFSVLDRFHVAVALVTVIGSTAFLIALMVMRADERRETVGILRLLGFSRGRILGEVLLEGLLIAACGALFGVVFSAATQGIVNRFFQWHYNTSLVFVRITPAIAAKCIALAVPLGVVAGLVASWTILRREITTLVRR